MCNSNQMGCKAMKTSSHSIFASNKCFQDYHRKTYIQMKDTTLFYFKHHCNCLKKSSKTPVASNMRKIYSTTHFLSIIN